MKQLQIAVLSDIHGNSWAFREVLSDIKSRGIESIINLGDSLYGPLDPNGTFKLLAENNVISISGNQDRIILENLDTNSDIPTLEYVKSQLDTDAQDWLKNLPFDLVHENEVYCCHASPENDSEYLLEYLQADHIAVKDGLQLDEVLKEIHQKIVVCGHSHLSRVVETENYLIINPGSVGLPAYDDELPIPHKMESFSPMARYCIVKMENGEAVVDQIAVSYDFEEAASTAEKNDRKDWARWIRMGRV